MSDALSMILRMLNEGAETCRRKKLGPTALRMLNEGAETCRRKKLGPTALRMLNEGAETCRRNELEPGALMKLDKGSRNLQRRTCPVLFITAAGEARLDGSETLDWRHMQNLGILRGEKGFWENIVTYREQPNIHFKHDYILVIETDRPEKLALCSTYETLSELSNGNNHCSVVKTRETDANRDGKLDELSLEIEVHLESQLNVHSVLLLLFFDYKLDKMCTLQMESLAAVQFNSGLPGARLDVIGDLELVQKQPLYTKGRDARYNSSIIDLTKNFPEAFNFKSLFYNYGRRNISTRLSNTYTLWATGRAVDMPFIISATIQYSEVSVTYSPGFWQRVKWAWMQYISVLIIFVYIFRKIKMFVFDNQLVFAVKNVPWKKLE